MAFTWPARTQKVARSDLSHIQDQRFQSRNVGSHVQRPIFMELGRRTAYFQQSPPAAPPASAPDYRQAAAAPGRRWPGACHVRSSDGPPNQTAPTAFLSQASTQEARNQQPHASRPQLRADSGHRDGSQKPAIQIDRSMVLYNANAKAPSHHHHI